VRNNVGVKTVLVLVLVAAGIWAALAWLAHRSAFFPMRYPQGWWQVQGEVGAEDVWITARDGVRLHCWWVGDKNASVATLFLHGNAGNVTHRGAALRQIAAAGSAVLLVDYRGYGKSEGSPSEAGLYRDAEAGYEWLLATGFAEDRIVIHGESLGTVVAVELASRKHCRGVVLEAPFSSARDVAGKVLPGVGPLLVWGFHSMGRIKELRAPLLVIHGDADEVIDIELGRRLFQAAREPKQMWVLRGGGHNNIVEAAGPEYARRLRDFYALLNK
jgi:pimeloyl-ACP methyl ester carboxylesterase